MAAPIVAIERIIVRIFGADILDIASPSCGFPARFQT
jgi:hypothetical protein